ncbi:NAD(P)-binding protein [Cutaneotrichosporon oleaginosum]|uniref:NAD(P)-binding protein n=1 Tax=Cutaneotrichosporon oleaginosum TaxID=879819 RepID=A0A0J0XGK7_9TREE|nr:NAD(P)-binding protein [Cutaneotrichosporon oleaginosum]KLT40198.1 NAD(P)-binding protein [Cutaneotrichosporon oleaginosum]TXT10511.1 hypothetical protein COLE_04445 [Cutaneotrichosporon oleaginosum]
MAINGEASRTVLITGAGGWLGSILGDALLADDAGTQLILADIVEPRAPKASGAVTIMADLTDPAAIDGLFTTSYGPPQIIYCLHGIMSRGAEDDFDLGMRANFDSIRLLLNRARAEAENQPPIKFIFTSSLAVYGGPLPDVVGPSTIATPEGSYGCGKLMSELLVNEYTRRGFIDGRILRLPTIVVRPGPPSNASSSFLSGIIREPLSGEVAVCPVGDSLSSPALELPVWVASPETTIRNFVIASHIPAEKFLPHTRAVYLPGFTTTVREELEALREVAGDEALKLVTFKDDATNRRIVGSWPARFDNSYPLGLGFVADEGGMVPIVRRFSEQLGKAARF